jgi:hypothetical protein
MRCSIEKNGFLFPSALAYIAIYSQSRCPSVCDRQKTYFLERAQFSPCLVYDALEPNPKIFTEWPGTGFSRTLRSLVGNKPKKECPSTVVRHGPVKLLKGANNRAASMAGQTKSAVKPSPRLIL